jgi:hypothetical protein
MRSIVMILLTTITAACSNLRRISGTIGLVLMLTGCDSRRPAPGVEPSPRVEFPQRSLAERTFDEKLAAIHEEWMGTKWNFSGVTRTPRQGAIACGYFVTTTLEQAGVKLERVRLAQAASEQMILALVKPEMVKRYRNVSIDAFLKTVKQQGEGYYIVGLDNHTGFLRVSSEGNIMFIHSGPGRGVVKEDPAAAPELAGSRYRVTGKLTRMESNSIVEAPPQDAR